MQNGKAVGMYDDNTTPTWAMLWAHGGVLGHRQGWVFAHVWPACDDVDSYTHLANLAIVPECFASLTDKDGPLTSYLQWHAWKKYKWKPKHIGPPQKPADYDTIKWRYFPKFDAPQSYISQKISQLDNERIQILRRIMEMRGML
jgi:hypothetical protein